MKKYTLVIFFDIFNYYKGIFPSNGIFIEPIIGYGFPFALNENKSDLDISGGLGIGLNIGWVF